MQFGRCVACTMESPVRGETKKGEEKKKRRIARLMELRGHAIREKRKKKRKREDLILGACLMAFSAQIADRAFHQSSRHMGKKGGEKEKERKETSAHDNELGDLGSGSCNSCHSFEGSIVNAKERGGKRGGRENYGCTRSALASAGRRSFQPGSQDAQRRKKREKEGEVERKRNPRIVQVLSPFLSPRPAARK